MRIPTLRGLIDRRLLVNYHVDPAVLARLLPAPFRPQLVRGYGLAGICLIRLKHVRPRFWPAALGLSSENAAHRIAVEWDEAGQSRCGVFIPRRDTSSRLNAWAGGRLFPGEHGGALFDVEEQQGNYHIAIDSLDGRTHVAVKGRVASELPHDSVFSSLDEASEFFRRGSLGYSVTRKANAFDGLELRCDRWSIEPLDVTTVESSFFQSEERFPAGSIHFDCALLMRNIEHEWHSRETLSAACADCCPAA